MSGPKLLRAHLKKHSLTLRQFAKSIGVLPSTLCRVTLHNERPGYEVISRLDERGVVPFAAWRKPEEKRRRAA